MSGGLSFLGEARTLIWKLLGASVAVFRPVLALFGAVSGARNTVLKRFLIPTKENASHLMFKNAF